MLHRPTFRLGDTDALVKTATQFGRGGDGLLVRADEVSVFTLEVGILMFRENFCLGVGCDYLLATTLVWEV